MCVRRDEHYRKHFRNNEEPGIQLYPSNFVLIVIYDIIVVAAQRQQRFRLIPFFAFPLSISFDAIIIIINCNEHFAQSYPYSPATSRWKSGNIQYVFQYLSHLIDTTSAHESCRAAAGYFVRAHMNSIRTSSAMFLLDSVTYSHSS